MASHPLPSTRSSQWPPTPPDPADPKEIPAVMTALEVMSTEREALQHLEHLYKTDVRSRLDLAWAVSQIARSIHAGGKLVVCGVGKSGKIGQKIEATMNSLGIYSAFLHPTEALHGDLGMVRPNDTMLMISFSGRSPELLSLVPHIPPTVPIIALTSHTKPADCPLLQWHARPGVSILLPAPIHESEEISLGVGAPTSSTTVALCLGDALAIAVARELHTAPGRRPADVFRSFHPGGAIGAGAAGKISATKPFSTTPSMAFDSPSSSGSSMWEELADAPSIPPFTLQPPQDHGGIPLDMLVPFCDIANLHLNIDDDPGKVALRDVLTQSYRNPDAKSWVLLGLTGIVVPRGLADCLLYEMDHNITLDEAMKNSSRRMWRPGPAFVRREKYFLVLHTTPLAELRNMVAASRRGPDPIVVIAVVRWPDDLASCIGMVDAHDVLA